jgi:hypothetical protein
MASSSKVTSAEIVGLVTVVASWLAASRMEVHLASSLAVQERRASVAFGIVVVTTAVIASVVAVAVAVAVVVAAQTADVATAAEVVEYLKFDTVVVAFAVPAGYSEVADATPGWVQPGEVPAVVVEECFELEY